MIDMTKNSPVKNIILFTIPMLIGNVFQQFYNITDSAIVGQFIGKEALAAVGASFPIMFFLIALIMGATMGITVMISQFYGAKDYENVKLTIETAYIFLFITSIIASVSGIFLNRYILVILKTPEEILESALLYINIMFYGLIFLFGYNSISAILRGLGDSKTPLYLLIISTITNIFLDLAFVILFGWGVWGVALATVISQGISFILGIIYLHKKNHLFRVNYFKLRFSKKIFLRSIKIGLPSGVQQMLVAAGMMALMRIVNNFGTDAIAAFTVAGRIDSFAMMPAMNLSMAMSTFVGQNIGAGKIDRIKTGVRSGLVFSLIISTVLSFTIIFTGKYLLKIFTNDPTVIAIGVDYFYIVAPFYVAFSTMFIFNGALRGAGDTIVPMFVTLLSLWVIRVPLSAYLSTFMGTSGATGRIRA